MSGIELVTVVGLAAAPVSELRGALPLAYFAFHWPLWLSFSVVVVANALAGMAIFLLLEPMSRFFRNYIPWLDAMYTRISRYAEGRHGERLQRGRTVALFVLVALPVPIIGGAWVGALLAHLTRMPPRQALPLISAGVIAAGVIVVGLIVFGGSVAALL